MSARQFRSHVLVCAALFFVTSALQGQQTAAVSLFEPPAMPAELFLRFGTTVYTGGNLLPSVGELTVQEDERDGVIWRYTQRGALIGALAGIAYVHVKTWGKCQDCMIPLPVYYPLYALPGAAVGAIGGWLWGEATLPRDPSP